jgi:hypothetical protein
LIKNWTLGQGAHRRKSRDKLQILRIGWLPISNENTYLYFIGGDGQCYDSLEISGNLSQVFSGRTIPAPFMPGLNVVKLRMKSDDSVEQTGFQLIFTTSECEQYSNSII